MFYRLKQVWWALIARPLTPEEHELVDRLLSPAEKELFYRFAVNDQNHSIRVVKYIIINQHSNRSLLKAALLHDIGKIKSGRLSIVDRSIAVAVKAILPKLSQAWGQGTLDTSFRFQKPSIVRAQHAEWGAEMMQKIDSDPLAVSLVRRHQNQLVEIASKEDELLAVLQIADDRC